MLLNFSFSKKYSHTELKAKQHRSRSPFLEFPSRLRVPILAVGLVLSSSFLHAQSSSAQVFRHLKISGNSRTKAAVFQREIGINLGDTVRSADSMAGVFQKRLSGLGLFTHVQVQWHADTLAIAVSERIYTWVMPYFSWADRNFNTWTKMHSMLDRANYGATLHVNNIAGQNYKAWLSLRVGFNTYFDAGIQSPFLKHNKGWAYGARLQYWQNHELWYTAVGDKLQFFNTPNNIVQKNQFAELTAMRRLNYYQRVEFGAGAGSTRLDSIVDKVGIQYQYDQPLQHEYFARVEWVHDRRDQRDYPSRGGLFRLGAKAILAGPKVASDRWLPTAWLRATKFIPLKTSGSQVLALGMYSQWMPGVAGQPYKYARQLGYQSDYVRGYEAYVADGSGFVLGKVAWRNALWRDKILHLKGKGVFSSYFKVPFSLWFNIFADAGRVYKPFDAQLNPISAQWQGGMGIGFDMIVCYTAMARIEYTMNAIGRAAFNVSYKNAF